MSATTMNQKRVSTWATRIGASILLLLAGVVPGLAQSYTVTPTPFQTALDNSGNIINNACIWTYLAGTSTEVFTYSDNVGTQNSNPIRADSAGRFTAFLLAGSAYKYVYEQPCTPPAHGTILRTADNISGVPASAATVDVTGTAGETISAGTCAYLSDGSGSKNSGQWYKCDATNPYSSTTAEVGIAPSAILIGATGTIRLAGQVTGLTSLTTGSRYFISASSPGAITLTAPSNNRRELGVADATSSLVLDANPTVSPVNTFDCGGRLTLTTGVPVTTADVTAATTLFFTPYRGGQCALWDGTWWTTRSFTELSIAVPATTSTMYDVWLFDNAGTLALELLAWTNDTTRATALTTQNGILAKTGATTRRYLGSFRTTTVSGQTEDSFAKRFVWNYYNRVRRSMRVTDTTNSWTYTTATWRCANTAGACVNQLAFVVGVAEVELSALVRVGASNSNATAVGAVVAAALDSTTAPSITSLFGLGSVYSAASFQILTAELRAYPAVGFHFCAWLEYSEATGTTTWYGDNTSATFGPNSGIYGVIDG